MKKNLLVFLSISLFINISFAQNGIETRIVAKIAPFSSLKESNSAMSMYKLLVDQEFDCENIDSFNVKLEHISFLNQIMKDYFFRDMKVTCRASGGDQWTPVDYIFDGETLKCKTPANSCAVKVSYTYYSDYFTKVPEEYSPGIFSFTPYLYSWHSWFFDCPEMKIETMDFSIPDNLWCFINVPGKLEKDKIKSEVDHIQNKDVSFYLLEKEYYKSVSFKPDSYVNINLYINKGFTLITDSLKNTIRYEPGFLPDSLPRVYKNRITGIINRLTSFFGVKQSLEINIADAFLTIGENGKQLYSWGQNVSMGENRSLILIDVDKWNTHGLTHELIHIFNSCRTSTTDSAHYFFDESLVEFLAICLDSKSKSDRDSLFNTKVRYVTENDSVNSSVFHLVDNKIDLSAGNGSSNIIYQKTPLVIYRFAQRIGEERFLMILKDFYNQVRNKDKVCMADFESVARRHGVTDEEWKWFMKYL